MLSKPVVQSLVRGAVSVRALRCASTIALASETEGVPSSKAANVPGSPAVTVKSLPSGLKVAAISPTNTQTIMVGLAVKSGSRFETGSTRGAAHMLQRMGFKDTTSRSEIKLLRDLELAGCVPSVTAGRETILYSVGCVPSAVDIAAEALAETAFSTSFVEWDVTDAKKLVQQDLATVQTQPEVQIFESLHEAAFGGPETPMGQSFYASTAAIGALSAETLAEYHQAATAAKGGDITLITSGLAPADAEALGAKLVGLSAASAGLPARPSPYVGGEVRLMCVSPYTHVALAMDVHKAGPAVAAVVKALLALASKGVNGATAFDFSYADSTLIGLYGGDFPGQSATDLATGLAKSIQSAATSSDLVQSAIKAAAIECASALSGTSAGAGVAAVACNASGPTAAHILAVKPADVQAAVRAGAGKLAVAVLGDISSVPKAKELADMAKA